MTENKLVPKLRFKEFKEHWKENKLGDIATFYNSKRVALTASDREKGEYPYYGASGIIDYVKDFIFEGEYILLGEDGANIVMRNSRLVFLAKGKFWLNNHAHIFQSKDSNAFLCEALERINYTKYNTGTAQPKLNSDVVKKIKLNLPSSAEQQKIAIFLTAVDKKLQQLTKKKELLSAYKKGVMQKIFSQELRFKDEFGNSYPDWEEKKLGEVCDIKKGKQLNKIELTEVGLYPALNGGINPSGYTNKWNTEKDTITISEGGNSCGYVNLSNTRFWCGGHCYSLLDIKDSVNFGYLFQILKFSEAHIMRLRVGSGLPNIQMKEIKEFSISIPKIIEQQKIANFLSSLDSKIELVSTQIENTKVFKKGLLQQMFV